MTTGLSGGKSALQAEHSHCRWYQNGGKSKRPKVPHRNWYHLWVQVTPFSLEKCQFACEDAIGDTEWGWHGIEACLRSWIRGRIYRYVLGRLRHIWRTLPR